MSRRLALVLLLGLAAVSGLAVAALTVYGGKASLEEGARQSRAWIQANPSATLTLFALWAFAANLLVLPFGTLSLLIAGGLATPLIPALIWWLAQCATAPIVHRLGARSLASGQIDQLIGRALPALSAGALRRFAQDNALGTSTLLRLAPLLPSAPAALVAAAIGLPSAVFLMATLLVGWVRPLYFAGLGSWVGDLAAPSTALTPAAIAPLAALFLLAAGAVGLRAWLLRRAICPPLPSEPDRL